MNDDLQSGDKLSPIDSTAASLEGAPYSHVPIAKLDVGTQSDVNPGLSSGESSPSASQEDVDHADGGSLPSVLNEDVSVGIASLTVAPTLPLPLGADAIISSNDVGDDDLDDEWFSPKGPGSGAEHGIKKPVQPIIKKLGVNSVVSSKDVEEDDDSDDDWFSPKGPNSGPEHGIKRPVKPIIKK